MYLAVILIVPFLCLSTQYVTQPDVSENSESANATETLETELSSLEKTVASLNDLATVHRQIWEKQVAHEEQVRAKNKEEEEREATRSRALEDEQIILREKSRNFSRKLKIQTKNIKIHGRSGSTLGDTSISSIFNKIKDCSDIYMEGEVTSGVYRMWPIQYQDGRGFPAYCDMDTDGGGWTVIQRWTAEEFISGYCDRSWNDYKHGFGDLESSFWIGNEQLHQLTNQGAYELRIDMETDEQKTHSTYRSFFIEDETTKYTLHVAEYQFDGTEGDVMMSHDGARFSTYDQNNLPKIIVYKEVIRNDGGFWGRRSEIVEEYVTSAGCAGRKACGWWFNLDCELDQKINFTTKVWKIEMKIRQRLFSQKITYSKRSVPLIR